MSNKSRLAAIALLFGCLGFVPLVLTMNRSPLPWNDEILWASTSYSVFRHGESAPSVLAEFPQAGRFDLFYGPVGFKLGVLAFKLFGISPISFRLLSLLGALIVTVASGLLVRVLGGSWLAAAVSFLLVALSPEIGSRATTGRLDTFTVGLELLALVALLTAFSRRKKTQYHLLAGLSGALLASAALSTPRSWTFLFALFSCSIIFSLRSREFRVNALHKIITAGLILSTALFLWVSSQKMTLLSWMRFIAGASMGDRWNSSPVLAGSWSLAGSNSSASAVAQGMVTPVLLLAIGISLAWAIRKFKDEGPALRGSYFPFSISVVILNAVVTLTLISRPLTYNIFWSLPILPVLVYATSKLFGEFSAAKRVWFYALWLSLAICYCGIRTAKFAEIYTSWPARNPDYVEAFIRANVPAGSRVYGPPEYYFYVVERAQSTYRYAEEWTTPGLARVAIEYRAQVQPPKVYLSTFLLWPRDLALPQRFNGRSDLVATLAPPLIKQSWIGRIAPSYTGGFPPTSLYKIRDEQSDGSAK